MDWTWWAEYIARGSTSVATLWMLYEIRQIDVLIKYQRLTRILRQIEKAVLAYMILRMFSSFIEYFFPEAGSFNPLSNTIFFVILCVILRIRRQRLANDWNNLPSDYRADQLTASAIDTLETTTKVLSQIK